MTTATRDMINSITEDIRQVLGIQGPIQNMDDVVYKLGGTIQDDFLCSDGTVSKEGRTFKIQVSPFQSQKRRRFTIAHELGHLFLHMGYLIDEELWDEQEDNIYHRSGSSEQEYQANEFAAAFLMPRNEYKKVMDEHTDGSLVNTAEIARHFHVSVSAAANRGKWLGYLKW